MPSTPLHDPAVQAAIIGCGMIAGGYNLRDAGDDRLTHAGALTQRGVKLVACVEPDAARRATFQTRWNVEVGYDCIEDMLSEHRDLDIVCICSPNERHAADLAALLATNVKIVFCEKPLAADIADARRIAATYSVRGRQLAVNYTRRWNSTFRALAMDIAKHRFGELTGVTAWYGKGIVHNGSHLLDLLRMLIGEIRPLRAERLVGDGRAEDPTVDALLRAQDRVPVRIIGTDYRHYDFFELQLHFESAVVSIENGGTILRTRSIERDPNFSQHLRLTHGERRDTQAAEAMLNAVDNIIANVRCGEPVASDAASALAAQEIAEQLKAMSGR
jgi:predicted dehydrogenase